MLHYYTEKRVCETNIEQQKINYLEQTDKQRDEGRHSIMGYYIEDIFKP